MRYLVEYTYKDKFYCWGTDQKAKIDCDKEFDDDHELLNYIEKVLEVEYEMKPDRFRVKGGYSKNGDIQDETCWREYPEPENEYDDY